MLPIEGQPILTVAQMRAAERRVAPTPEAMYQLMERAGQGVAEAVRRLAAGEEVLILCGPGNNGGDGYVAARVLRKAGHPVRVAALGEPTTELARRARAGWDGPVEPFPLALSDEHVFAPVVVDAVFGIGLSRAPDEHTMLATGALARQARLAVAVDLPTGVSADTGEVFGHVPPAIFDLTLALGAPKPAHVLMPAAERCGTVRVIDLALTAPPAPSDSWSDRVIAPASLGAPSRSAHKFSRGLVAVIGGAMPGAASLAVTAAMRAGAGYGVLFSDHPSADLPHAIVQRGWSPKALAATIKGKRNVVLVIGPGLGRDADARAKLDAAIACECTIVIDADALHLLTDKDFTTFAMRDDEDQQAQIVLTPHAGEFAALFGAHAGSKIEAAREAACRASATVVYKGPDTVVAHMDGGTSTLVGASAWLSTAGTGDVLAGTIAGVWQATSDPAEAGVWLHAEAARRCGASFIADDLLPALSAARASL